MSDAWMSPIRGEGDVSRVSCLELPFGIKILKVMRLLETRSHDPIERC